MAAGFCLCVTVHLFESGSADEDRKKEMGLFIFLLKVKYVACHLRPFKKYESKAY